MKLLITGSRNLDAENAMHLITKGIAAITQHLIPPSQILHGGAKGVDAVAGVWAQRQGIQQQIYQPDYPRYGSKAAPLQRNAEMVSNAEAVLAIYAAGKWRKGGTWDTVKRAAKAGRPILELEASTERLHYTPQAPLLL
jgi:hypothetical protein